MDYLTELKTIQMWVKAVAGMNSVRLKEAKPKLARPVILWETPSREKKNNIGQYVYIQSVRQYGRLFANSLDDALDVQEKLTKDLEGKGGVLPIMQEGILLGYLKAAVIEFNTSESLDVPFNIAYEVTYGNTRPVEAPNATYVGTRVDTLGAELTQN